VGRVLHRRRPPGISPARLALFGLLALLALSGCAGLRSQPRYRTPEPAPAPPSREGRPEAEKGQRGAQRELERQKARTEKEERKARRRDARKGGGLRSFQLFSRGSADLLESAEKYLGVPYRFGGDTRRGMDCSGLVWRAVKEAWGRELPRSSTEMFHLGMPVSRSELQPGDLLFFHTGSRGRVSHVGIYEGEGLFIHSSTTKGVEVTTMDEGYWRRRLVGARRLTPSSITP
jgi:cell wall-associated NlpC family hydrolase